MGKVSACGTMAIFLSLVITGASASLVPVSFGFPVLFQDQSATAFHQNAVGTADLESMNIDFMGFDGMPLGSSSTSTTPVFGMQAMSFPMISQDSLKTQTVSYADFSQNSQTMAYAYPFVGATSASLPAFNFGF